MKQKHFFLTGATGLIGTQLLNSLLIKNYSITALSRNPSLAKQKFPQIHWLDHLPENFDSFYVVINLAGEPIFSKPWTVSQKKILWQSRVDFTAELVKKINTCQTPPRFFSASATGFYGDRKKDFLTEEAQNGDGFCAALCKAWEAQALKANTKTTILRFGQVMSPQGGALKTMLPLFQHGLGGKLGSGEQFISWISINDVIQAILFLIEKDITGPFNLTAPEPLPQKIFAQQLSNHYKKRLFLPAPKIGLFLLFGERSELLLHSQRAVPQRLLKIGFTFQHSHFKDYLKSQATSLNLR